MDMSNHPIDGAQAEGPRERIVAALRQRAGAAPESAPEAAPGANLPALPSILSLAMDALPGDEHRAPQTEFTRARQTLFLENLSVTGSVRSAAAAASVSHQTVYRARRATGAFRLAWDAALVVARANAEAVLAARAIDGMTEEVRYHGEVVGTRTRYCSRLLLAHLARLDRLAETPDAAAFAGDWVAELARFERGEEVLAGASGGPSQAPENPFPEPCNTRSMSPPDEDAEALDDEEEWEEYEDEDDEDWGSPGDHADLLEGESRAEARLPLTERLLAAMARRRPADAPHIPDTWGGGELEAEQLGAFTERVEEWWLVVPPGPFDPPGEWRYHGDQD